MKKYLEKINLGLIIDCPQVFIMWNATESHILNLLYEHGYKKIKEHYYITKVKIFDNNFGGFLGLHFSGNDQLFKIEIFKEESTYINDETISNSYNENQKLLELYFGKPSRISAMAHSFFKTNHDDKKYEWHFKNVLIVHSLWDRFGLEEHLEIIVN